MKATNSNWGHCSRCKHFDSPAKMPLPGEEASCKEPTLSKFQLRVFGTCGCSQFSLRAGLPATPEAPPTGRRVAARL